VALTLPPLLVSALWAHAERDFPRECVGALGGLPLEGLPLDGLADGPELRALALYPLPNIAPDPQRTYLADPGHLLRALRAMGAGGLTLVGLYHSHPHGPAWPSATDTHLAAYPVPYVIADLRTRTLNAYHLPDATPVLLRLDIDHA
jgi:proteasome lid subunit RPN8/RPN11